jgi:hypothetical protein
LKWCEAPASQVRASNPAGRFRHQGPIALGSLVSLAKVFVIRCCEWEGTAAQATSAFGACANITKPRLHAKRSADALLKELGFA